MKKLLKVKTHNTPHSLTADDVDALLGVDSMISERSITHDHLTPAGILSDGRRVEMWKINERMTGSTHSGQNMDSIVVCIDGRVGRRITLGDSRNLSDTLRGCDVNGGTWAPSAEREHEIIETIEKMQ